MSKKTIAKEIERAIEFKLKRAGCPVEKIPQFSGREYFCRSKDEVVYSLADGTKCCRKGTGKPQKAVPYKEKPQLEKPTVKTVDGEECILNPRTKRWVKRSGKVGKEVEAGFYL